MGLELKPSVLVSSLEHASNNFESIVGTIKSLERSIDRFVNNTYLDGPGYKGLKGNMSNRFIPMLSSASNAIEDLLSANKNHINALEHVRKYPVLNQTQIDSEIEQLERLIRNLQNTPGMIPSALIGPEERLRFLVQKRRDFQAYLSTSNGIYSASASSLSQLDSALTTLELATFNVITGKWILPPLSKVEMKILERDLELDREKAMSYVMTDGEWNWDLIAMILGKPYSEITNAEWLALTYLVVEMNDENLGNFLMLFAYQVENPLEDDSSELWKFCSKKLGILQDQIDRIASANLDMQLMIRIENRDNPYLSRLENHRSSLLQLSGLLETLSRATAGVNETINARWPDSFFAGLLGDGSGAGPTIVIENIGRAFVVTYSELHKIVRRVYDTGIYHDVPQLLPKTIVSTVSRSLGSMAANIELRDVVIGNILANNNFDLATEMANNIAMASMGHLVGMALGSFPVAAGGASLLPAVSDAFQAQSANENLVSGIESIEEWWGRGCLLHFFSLETVMVSNNQEGIFHIPRESVYTIPVLMAWNSYTGNNYSMEQLREKLPSILSQVSNMEQSEVQSLQSYVDAFLGNHLNWQEIIEE